MHTDLAAGDVITPYNAKPLRLGLVLLWIVATGTGWFALIVGSGLGCVLITTPLLAALLGELQRRVLKLAGYSLEAGWTMRTVLGWLAGLVVWFVVLKIMSAIYHSARDFSGLGLISVTGDQVEVATQVLGLALMGAVIGAFQWLPWSRWPQLRNDSQYLWQLMWWSLINAIAWGAGAVVSWAAFKAYVIGHEPVFCFDCIIALFWSGMVSGLVIAVVTGFALWHRPVGALFGVAVGVVATYLVLNNMTVGLAGKFGLFERNSSSDYDPEVSTCNALSVPSLLTPTAIAAFEPREMGPSRILDSSLNRTEYVAISNDGKILAAQKYRFDIGYLVESKVLIWRTSDWDLIGTIPITNTTVTAQQTASAAPMHENGFKVISGTLVAVVTVTPSPIALLPSATIDYPGGIRATAVLSPDGKIHIWSASEGKGQSELNTVDLQSWPTSTVSPDGQVVITKLRWTSELRRTSDCSLITYLAKPHEVEYSSPNWLVFAFSPDGRFIAGGSENGGVWLWDIPH